MHVYAKLRYRIRLRVAVVSEECGMAALEIKCMRYAVEWHRNFGFSTH